MMRITWASLSGACDLLQLAPALDEHHARTADHDPVISSSSSSVCRAEPGTSLKTSEGRAASCERSRSGGGGDDLVSQPSRCVPSARNASSSGVPADRCQTRALWMSACRRSSLWIAILGRRQVLLVPAWAASATIGVKPPAMTALPDYVALVRGASAPCGRARTGRCAAVAAARSWRRPLQVGAGPSRARGRSVSPSGAAATPLAPAILSAMRDRHER